MGICRDGCQCLIEGERGLEGDGLGDALHPFTVGPAQQRTIPSTVDTLNDLDFSAPEEEVGQVALVRDTGLIYGYNVFADPPAHFLEVAWQATAPDWGQWEPRDMSLPQLDSPADSEDMELRPGMWDFHLSGYVVCEVAAGDWTVFSLALWDEESGLEYDEARVIVANDSGTARAQTGTFTLQAIVSSGAGSTNPADTDKRMILNCQRLTADDNSGNVVQIKARAVRLASHSAF